MLENFANNAQTTLASAVTSPTMTLTVTSSSGFPSTPFRVRLGDELLLVTNVSGTTWTLAAAAAANHAVGDTVTQVLTAAGLAAITLQTPPGRLSASTDAVATSDVTGASTLRYLPYQGRQIWLYANDEWAPKDIGSSGLSLSLSSLVAYANYDVFAYNNAGVPALELHAWNNATVSANTTTEQISWTGHGMVNGDPVAFSSTGSLPGGLTANTQYYVISAAANTFQVATSPTGSAINLTSAGTGTLTAYSSRARQANLDTQDGWLVKGGNSTRLFLGTVRTTGTTSIEDSKVKRLIWNMYNRVSRPLYDIGSYSGTYGTGNWRRFGGGGGPTIEFVVGLVEDALSLWGTGAGSSGGYSAVGFSSASSGYEATAILTGRNAVVGEGAGQFFPSLGYNLAHVWEYGTGAGSKTHTIGSVLRM